MKNIPQNDKAACEKLDAFLEKVDSKAKDESLTRLDAVKITQQAKAIKDSFVISYSTVYHCFFSASGI